MRCKQCDQVFTPNKYTKNRQVFCSRDCQNKYFSQHSKYQYICGYCGNNYIAKQKDRNQYCSRECYFKDKHDKKLALAEVKALLRQSIPVRQRECSFCGKPYEVGKGYDGHCSRNCELKHGRQNSRKLSEAKCITKTFSCKECGNPYRTKYGDKHRDFCSKNCLLRYSKREGKARRRARIKQVEYEPVNPIIIFNRDKWSCKLCGIKTPQRLRGTTKDNAPEMDHIIPLALGGAHRLRNLQCLCRKCNQAKGARTLGQLIMCI